MDSTMRGNADTARCTARRLGAAAAAALALAGCQLGPRPLEQKWAQPSGQWAVTSVLRGANVRYPGEVIARFGQPIRYEEKLAVSGSESCPDPVYVVNAMLADRYLYAGFGLRPADLGLYRWQDVRITEVFCNGRKWRALGGDAFWVDDELGYAVRDGTLYELRRQRSGG